MKKLRNYSTTGLSMSQAQSISNACNQKALVIDAQISKLNNATKTVKVDGTEHKLQSGYPVPTYILQLLKDKAKLHATQAFLVEAIKSKDEILADIENEYPHYTAERPVVQYESEPELENLVDEGWGWTQLTDKEFNEFLEVEAYASHIGKFMHTGGKLATLRKELPNMAEVEWMDIETGKKTPVTVNIHHTDVELGLLHENLAAAYQEYEQRVNYYKAKVKNIVAEKNMEISAINSATIDAYSTRNDKLRAEYEGALDKWSEERAMWLQDQKKIRAEKIKKITNLRIVVDPRFQDVIDMFSGCTKEK